MIKYYFIFIFLGNFCKYNAVFSETLHDQNLFFTKKARHFQPSYISHYQSFTLTSSPAGTETIFLPFLVFTIIVPLPSPDLTFTTFLSM